MRSLAEACSDIDFGTVRKLLDEDKFVHETTEEGESLLSLACSACYYELDQVCYHNLFRNIPSYSLYIILIHRLR